MTSPPPDYDGIARAYRWLEYLTLGPLLQRTRTAHLSRLRTTRQALILGDGDGRFTAALLGANPAIQVKAVDASAAMLRLLHSRCLHNPRLLTVQTDARTFNPTCTPDLVGTHFFLDCLTQPEVDSLVARLTPTLAPDARWLVSDFQIPAGFMNLPARIYIRLLYLAFRLLTGTIPTSLPNHALALERAGFSLIAEQQYLFGILTSQLWQHE